MIFQTGKTIIQTRNKNIIIHWCTETQQLYQKHDNARLQGYILYTLENKRLDKAQVWVINCHANKGNYRKKGKQEQTT